MPPELPRWWVALTGIHLALGGHRCVATCCRYSMIRVFRQGCRMHINGGRGHESVIVHQADAIIIGSAPYTSVGRHCQVKVTRNLEGGLLGECWVAGDVKGKLHAQHISTPIDTTSNEISELRGLCPLPRSTKQVAIC